MTTHNPVDAKNTLQLPIWAMGLLPLVLLVIVVALFLTGDPLAAFTGDAPPIEELQVQQVVLDDEGIAVKVMNSGPDPVKIAQVLVDEAYWNFSIEGDDNTLGRLETATLHIPYPWVAGEAHEVVVLSSTGVTFPVEIPVAVATPQADTDQFWAYGLLGVYVGIVPVALGLLWYPFMRSVDRRWLNFALALTVGLLVFLAVDTLLEGVEIAQRVPGTFQGEPLLFLIALLTFLSIVAIGRNSARRESRLFLAYMIALGIGFHNLGEGLAVGAAFALGEVSLAAFLVVGFTLHNITEGIGIASPIAVERPRPHHFGLLALLAGGPAILGTWLGGFAFNPVLGVVFLGVGAGAILQVVYEVSRLIAKDSQRYQTQPLSWLNLAGLFSGIAIMYFTAFLVA